MIGKGRFGQHLLARFGTGQIDRWRQHDEFLRE
jgi:hypothetical protein